MTKDDVIRLAREAGIKNATAPSGTVGDYFWGTPHQIEAFAKLVAEHEREACAKLVEDSWMAFSRASNARLDITPFPELSYVAKVIRARGQE